jgi:hypothetical protein
VATWARKEPINRRSSRLVGCDSSWDSKNLHQARPSGEHASYTEGQNRASAIHIAPRAFNTRWSGPSYQ